MAGQMGDVCQVTLRSSYLGQQNLNVFYYRLEDIPSDGYLQGLVTEFQETVLVPLAACQLALVDYQSVTALNIFSLDLLEETDLTPTVGTLPVMGDGASSLLAGGVKLVRSNGRVKNGYKYVSGFSEGYMATQVFDPAYVTRLQTFADACAATLEAGVSVDTFAPVIVGRVSYLTDQGRTAYRLPESQAEMGDRWAYVISGLANPVITTMRSRKQGRGV